MKKLTRFDLASLGLIILIGVFSAIRFKYLPQFIDGYYHLSVANGFIFSGGWVGWDWWSWAPFGRPHLYPPFYHLLLSFMQSIGISGLNSLRIVEASITPLFFFTLWYVCSRVFNSRVSFFTVLSLSSFFSFYSAVSANVPASFAMIFGFLAWFFLDRKKLLSAAICLALTFYTHAAVCWMFFISILFVAVFDRSSRKLASSILLISLVLVLPFLLHQFKYMDYLDIKVLGEAKFIHFSIFLILFGSVSCIYFIAKKESFFLIILGYLFAALLLFAKYPYRFFSAQGILAAGLGGALLLERVFSAISQKKTNVLIILVSFYLFFSHATLDLDEGEFKLNGFNSTFFNFLTARMYTLFEFRPLLPSSYYLPISRVIKDNTSESDIIYSNSSIAGQIFSALTKRPSSDSMLWEVKPKREFRSHEYAKLIIWMKSFVMTGITGKEELRWRKIYEDDISYIFLNEKYKPSLEPKGAAINFRFIVYVLAIMAFAFLFDRCIDWEFLENKPFLAKPKG